MIYHLAIIVTPNFNAMATTTFIDPFRAANYMNGASLYQWSFLSSEGGNIRASNGMTLDTESIRGIEGNEIEMGVISSSWTPETFYADRSLLAKIRQWGRMGVALCGLDTGVFILAQAGQLNGHSATVHYEHLDALREMHTQVKVRDRLFIIDKNILSSAGGIASADLALQIIRKHHGNALANAAAQYIFHDRLRSWEDRQIRDDYQPIGHTVPLKLREAVSLMEGNLVEPLSIPDIAKTVKLSHRQLTRLFKNYTNSSAVQYYRDLRLDHGRSLVTQTDMSVLDVAVACGFGSAEHFSRVYRKRFNVTPRDDRITGRVPFEFRAGPMHRRV